MNKIKKKIHRLWFLFGTALLILIRAILNQSMNNKRSRAKVELERLLLIIIYINRNL